MLQHAPRALMTGGGVLVGIAVLIALLAEGRPGVIYVLGGIGLLMAGFGFTVYLFIEGVAGRRTGG